MSTDEQHAAVGRLLAELSAAKKELALVREEIRSTARLVGELAQLLAPALDAASPRADALRLVNELMYRDTFARLKALLEDAETLSPRIAQIQATLKDSGIEL